MGFLGSFGARVTQRAQYPLIKEHALNYDGILNMIYSKAFSS